MDVVIGTAVLGGAALTVGSGLFLKAALRTGSLPVTAEWIDELSIERYRPMLRLLEEEDLEYLRSQPGFTPAMLRKLRAQRCQLFRGYLRCLDVDFARVCAALKIVMLQSKRDRPDLASALFRQQILFTAGSISIQLRLFLYRLGFCGVDVSGLVKNFDMLRLELKSLVPVHSGAAA